MSFVYQWDEAKRIANLKKHKLDFRSAHLVYESPHKVTYRIQELPEKRFLDLALVEINRTVLALIYTVRNGNVRFISFRYASRRERRRYDAARR